MGILIFEGSKMPECTSKEGILKLNKMSALLVNLSYEMSIFNLMHY